jgi:UDP-glucuronate 4-epimerase
MNILVTGGAGFIGSHVCEKLLVAGHKVTCLDSLNDYYPIKYKEANLNMLNKKEGFSFSKIDLADKKAVESMFSEQTFDVVIHLAARAGVRYSIEHPNLYVDANITGTLNLLECLKNTKTRFIFGSSSSVYGADCEVPFSEDKISKNPKSPYAITKLAGEMFCKNYHDLYGLSVIILRFFTVYGPRGRPDMAPYKFTEKISKGLKIQQYGDGSSSRDYTFVSDIAEGVIAAMDLKGFEIINLGDSNPVKLSDFIKIIEEEVGKKADIEVVGEQPGDVPRTYADISKAKKLLGYEPKVSIKEGINKFVRWYEDERA